MVNKTKFPKLKEITIVTEDVETGELHTITMKAPVSESTLWEDETENRQIPTPPLFVSIDSYRGVDKTRGPDGRLIDVFPNGNKHIVIQVGNAPALFPQVPAFWETNKKEN